MCPVNVGWAIESTAIMEVQDHVHLIVEHDGLDPGNGVELRVAITNGSKLPVEVPVHSPAAFDDTDEVQVGYHPDVTFLDPVMGNKKRGGIETTRLITLDTADHQQGITRPVRFKLVKAEIEVVVRHGGSGENN
jgi:hypothetical protein